MNPLAIFEEWYAHARQSSQPMADAMTLATASKSGRPSARMVLFKGFSEQGEFLFFTNYGSQKSRELLKNPYAALVFYWSLVGRQVRVEGRVKKVVYSESDEYFQTRPRESQIGAHASVQSTPVKTREILLSRFEKTKSEFGTGHIPCPKTWGGWALKPTRIEFWE
ncbi:MAG: pyridoxamine 5'-phosphate oxidase, partial [Bdellovibrionota bacterium]